MLLLVESRMKLLAFSKTKVLRHHHYLKNFSMLDPQSMVVRDFASSRPLPLTKERKEMLSDILSRIVEDVYSVLDDFLKSKYLLQLQVESDVLITSLFLFFFLVYYGCCITLVLPCGFEFTDERCS
ncbi:uncharacterized protein LOC107847040 isoform X1 [Capsicum annuum]|uniref:uncharacterized protein LOC107847040 isoform X1 n=1 Tax=Capsicum annuum TaxID=4072 RepID=UPI001FB090AE|nr:uncharacterized protein LOC107847040 isoform X1 [Capsicum annuum]